MITPDNRDRCESMLLHYEMNWKDFGHWRCFYKFNEHFRWEPENDWANAFRLKCYAEDVRANTTSVEVYDAAKLFLRRIRKLKDILQRENRFDTMYFLHMENGIPSNRSNTSRPSYVMKSQESLENKCDVDIIKNFVFTVKVKKESLYGDFDHILIKYRNGRYDNVGEWKLFPVSRAYCWTPCGDYTLPKDDTKFRRILKYMNNLGEHKVSQDDCGRYNPFTVSKLAGLAEAIPQTYIGKLYTDNLLADPGDS